MCFTRAFVISLICISLTLIPSFVDADGDGTAIYSGREGSYQLTLNIQPDEPSVGTVQFSLLLLDAATGEPVEKAQILIVAIDDTNEPVYQSPALHSPTSPASYIGNINFRKAGEWTLDIRVKSDTRGEASFAVPLLVQSAYASSGPEGLSVLLVIILALVGGVIYLWYTARRTQGRSRTSP